jgi:hypothetical protein
MIVRVCVPGRRITDWQSFQAECCLVLPLPVFDYQSVLEWSLANIATQGCLAIDLADSMDFMRRCPAQFNSLVDILASVNREFIARKREPAIALSLV